MQGGIVWLTGLSGAGKSTIATALFEHLNPRRPTELLDGDEVRTFLTAGLGFTRTDRGINVRRIGFVARLLAKHGVLVLVSAISPYEDVRTELREISRHAGHPFLEIYVNAPLDTVIGRDVKGLYRKAQAGEIPHFTGISDPYEPPTSPALEVRTDQLSRAECEQRILAVIARHQLV